MAHNCGAAGLFSDKVHPDVILEAHEVDGLYILTVTTGETVQTFEGPVSS
ncbi:MAG: Radical SAM protein, partial [Veillonella sp. DORA_B_18_19_23]